MFVYNFIRILDAVTRLLAEIAWPLLVIFVLFRFRTSFQKFFDSMGEFSFKAAGVEASAKRAQIEAAANLAAAEASDPKSKIPASVAAQSAADFVVDNLTIKNLRRLDEAKILWVDDEPSNNRAQINLFNSLGVKVTLASNTDAALKHLQKESFNLVISDMGRPPDSRAGYTLLSRMREMKISTPYLIYAANGDLPKHHLEALNAGAIGSTSGTTELLNIALRVLRASVKS